MVRRVPGAVPKVVCRKVGGMGWAVEEMVGGRVERKTLRADRVVGPADEHFVRTQTRTEA